MSTRFVHLSDPQWLRQMLLKNNAPLSDASSLAMRAVPAAVLVALVLRPENIGVLLTERSARLKHHPGQISFPGGKIESADVSPEAAALRETCEETGIASHHILPVGRLADYTTGTGYHVTPVVATLTPGFSLQPATDEVQSIFELPLNLCMNKHAYTHKTLVQPDGSTRSTYSLQYGERLIWGATATILYRLGTALEWPH